MLTALAESVCLAIEADHLPDNFSTGLHDLFQASLRRFAEAIEQLQRARKQIEGYAENDEDRQKRREASVFSHLTGHLIQIVAQVWRENGKCPSPDGVDGVRAEPAVAKLAEHYAFKIMDMMENRTDLREAGSFLPWAELQIRAEVLGTVPDTSPKAAPAAIRDQFIMGAHRDGYSPADISMALGLPQGAVLRIIGRLAGAKDESRKAV